MQIASTPTINSDASAALLKQISSNFAKLDTTELSLSSTSEEGSNDTRKKSEKAIVKNDNGKVTRSSKNDTKNRSAASRDCGNCLICGWSFPHSFQGEEKNSHIYRCMENKSDKDRKFWLKCQGNLKQYMHGFEEYLLESGGNRAKNLKFNDAGDLQDSQLGSTTTQARKLKKTKNRKQDASSKKSGDFASFEPVMAKKLKPEENSLQAPKKTWTNVLLLPVVRTLVFDPSKEFKNPRK